MPLTDVESAGEVVLRRAPRLLPAFGRGVLNGIGKRPRPDAVLDVTEVLELSVYGEELRAHRRGTEVVMVTEARRAGRLVRVDRSSYLARHRTTAGPGGPDPAEPPADDAAGPAPRPREWRLPADLGRRHAAVSGNHNPIHLHPLTARPLGFPRALTHGMWTFARCAAEAVPPGAAPVRLTAAFRAPVPMPATVTYTRRDAPDGTGSTFQLRGGPAAGHPEGRVHLYGTARYGTVTYGTVTR
ncbi:MaoC family dehydratase [Streptomyces lydicus]|uniref:MaoC family dehydratase n=1 Tax=Streptomyces lydicus TaxID=47763 RepID=UPI00379905F7